LLPGIPSRRARQVRRASRRLSGNSPLVPATTLRLPDRERGRSNRTALVVSVFMGSV